MKNIEEASKKRQVIFNDNFNKEMKEREWADTKKKALALKA